jgi:hypothetical protein
MNEKSLRLLIILGIISSSFVSLHTIMKEQIPFTLKEKLNEFKMINAQANKNPKVLVLNAQIETLQNSLNALFKKKYADLGIDKTNKHLNTLNPTSPRFATTLQELTAKQKEAAESLATQPFIEIKDKIETLKKKRSEIIKKDYPKLEQLRKEIINLNAS